MEELVMAPTVALREQPAFADSDAAERKKRSEPARDDRAKRARRR
jgi:hypothetical protein